MPRTVLLGLTFFVIFWVSCTVDLTREIEADPSWSYDFFKELFAQRFWPWFILPGPYSFGWLFGPFGPLCAGPLPASGGGMSWKEGEITAPPLRF